MLRFAIGLFVGLLLFLLLVLGWLKMGHPPVAVADGQLPFERQIVNVPMHSRIESEMPKSVPLQPSTAAFLAGAQIYREQCAACHGFQGRPSDFAAHIFPRAPQLLLPYRNGEVIGVSDDPPGETYWKVKNSLRLTGMPAYDKVLSDQQIWQVSLLVASADKPLPPEVVAIVHGQPSGQAPEGVTPANR